MSVDREADGEPGGRPGTVGPGDRLRVFVSSTLGELAPEREAAKSAIKTLRLRPIGLDLGAGVDSAPGGPADADIFVGIYWQSYGWVAEGTASDLELDYLHGTGMPRLVYVKEPSADRELRLSLLLDRIRSDGVPMRTFEAPGDLAEMLVDDLASLMSERFAPGESETATHSLGTLTFMFGDIEGSTALLERVGEDYSAVLTGYHGIVDRATRRHQGTADLEGEKVFAVFLDALEAARAGVEVQREIAAAEWPGSVSPRCRLGLHTGTARIGSGGYVGLDVHRASRIASAAHGGQILISAPVRELIDPAAEQLEWQLVELGSFALKGLARAERLFQLVASGLESDFPPPRARSTTRVRLPASATGLVGRERELPELVDMVNQAQVRLATITGPGGIGKTRLAIATAEELAPSFPDGVYFVNLAPLTDPEQVLIAIGAAAGIPIEGDAIDSLAGEFQDQRVLLLMDNFEQVIGAGSDVGRLLARSPGLKVLATSRVPLRIMSEHEYMLEPLGLPDPGSERPESVSASAAVRLFMDRALAVIPGFSINEENASPVASIVRVVDGLPLAIELAAARLRMLSPKALSDRLSRSLDALGAGAADAPTRQRTLDAAIDWSYQLLTLEEKTLFNRLCVFQGGFTVESAQDVAVEEGDVVDQLMALVENSLVLAAHGGEGRLRMLAPIREFGLRRLHESGEYGWVRDRHAAYFVRLAEDALPELRGAKQAAIAGRLADEWNNISVAFDWLSSQEDQASMVRMMYGLWVFLWISGHLRDSESWLLRITRPDDLDQTLRGRYWWLRGGIGYELGDYPGSKAAIDRALETLETSGDIDCHNWAEFLSSLLGPVLEVDPGETKTGLERSLTRFRAFGDRWGEGYALVGLGILANTQGEHSSAEEIQLEVRELGVELGNSALIGLAEAQLGFTYVGAGRLDEAREALRRSFDLFRRMNYREGLCYALEAAASLSFNEGRAELGMVALGAAEEVRDRIGLHPWPLVRWMFDMLSGMADSLDDAALQSARHNGRQMNPFDAAALVLDTVPSPV